MGEIWNPNKKKSEPKSIIHPDLSREILSFKYDEVQNHNIPKLKQLSISVFGSDDYIGTINALAPSDYLVKQFIQLATMSGCFDDVNINKALWLQ